MTIQLRSLGRSDLAVSPVGFGCWPLAGVTSLGVEDSQGIETIRTALECGINLFDTAFSYGADGRSDRVLRQALADVPREKYILCSKVGTHYDASGKRVVDGRAEILIEHTKRSVERLGVTQIDLMYLHQPDPRTDLRQSAEAFAELQQSKLVAHVGLSNANLQECQTFHSVCPLTALQIPFNMLQQETYRGLVDWCLAEQIGITSFWVLMKGLFAGKIEREHQLDVADRRRAYAMYQAEQWDINQDFVDVLRKTASSLNWSVAQLVVRWSLERTGMTSCLVGAKRPDQIRESAAALQTPLPDNATATIEEAIEMRLRRGPIT